MIKNLLNYLIRRFCLFLDEEVIYCTITTFSPASQSLYSIPIDKNIKKRIIIVEIASYSRVYKLKDN